MKTAIASCCALCLGAVAALLAGCGVPPLSLSKGQADMLPPTGASGAVQAYQVLHFFSGPPDGGWPDVGRLVFDKSGNLYGATYIGGSGICKFRKRRAGCGAIFELSPRPHGGWTEQVIYSFKSLDDGASPYSTLTLDSSGDIYGVTIGGGNRGCLFWIYRGCGTVFELVRHHDAWTKRLLHIFSGGADGGNPLGDLTFDDGTLYGTASCGGGSYSCYTSGSGAGVFFALKHSGKQWAESVLQVFGPKIGGYPHGDLTTINRNTILGTTGGSIYRMSRSSSSWKETTLYLFPGNDPSKGSSPNGGLVLDGKGNIYGVTAAGGDFTGSVCSQGCGVVFELSQSSGSSWSETVLYTFSGRTDGATSAAGLAIDAAGRLIGTTSDGGDLACNAGWGCGVVFSVTPRGTASTEQVLHAFEDNATDGGFPLSAVLLDARGRIYGSTWVGGTGSSYGNGTVYEITRRS